MKKILLNSLACLPFLFSNGTTSTTPKTESVQIIPKEHVSTDIKIQLESSITSQDIISLFNFVDIDGSTMDSSLAYFNKSLNTLKYGTEEYVLSIKSLVDENITSSISLNLSVTDEIVDYYLISGHTIMSSSTKALTYDSIVNTIATIEQVRVESLQNIVIDSYENYVANLTSEVTLNYEYKYTDGFYVRNSLVIKPVFYEKRNDSNIFYKIQNFFGKHFYSYYHNELFKDGFKWKNFGWYTLYFVGFGWFYMPFLNLQF